MENAADALKMAGAVLLFVLALSIIIFYFGQARESADTILNYRDRETAYIEGNYYYDEIDTPARTVGLDTIIPSVFRAYLENYTIVFDGLDSPIYIITNSNGDVVKKYTLDLESNINKDYPNFILSNDKDKANFIRIIMYGKYKNSNTINQVQAIDKRVSLENCENLYEQLTNKLNNDFVIHEFLGEYYQNNNENEPNVNKTKKRIITYRIENKQ